jgi:MYXO-CTERM domain-containing protein
MRRLSYRSCCSLIAGLGLLLAARPGAASTPQSTYVVPTAVELLPSEANATRAVIHGAFFQLNSTTATTYDAPKCGVMYFACVAGQETMCRMQWSELRAAIGQHYCSGFGSLSTLPTAPIRAEGAVRGAPDQWDLGMGIALGSFVDGKCAPAQALVCPLASAADGGATADAAPATDATTNMDAPAAITDAAAETGNPASDAAAATDAAAIETGTPVPEAGGTDVATTSEPDATTEHPATFAPDAGAGNDARPAPATKSSGCALGGGSASAPPLALLGLLALGLASARRRRP